MNKAIAKYYGWGFVRPIRWLFQKMVWSYELRWKIKSPEYVGLRWELPNLHWWLLYKTVFKFFKWLYYDAWRPFCNWEGGYRRTHPLIARIIHKIGATTAGYAISGGQCYHCSFDEGDPVELSQTEEHFELEKAWTESTQDGTDHRFRGVTTCPICGFEDTYEDGSL